MEFVLTTQGARSLVHQGYKYTLSRRTADGQTYWRCHDRSCPGIAVTDTTNQLVSCNNKHSHPPNTAERAAEVVKERMKKRAKEETAPIPCEDDAKDPRQLLFECVALLYRELVYWLQVSTKTHDGRPVFAKLALATCSHTGIPLITIDYIS